MIDTHCHLSDETFTQDIEEVISRARNAGVVKIVSACVEENDFESVIRLYHRFPDIIIPTLGIHPEEMSEDIEEQLSRVLSLLNQHPEIQAIGEIGLDLHWDQTRLDEQKIVFMQQIKYSLMREGDYSMPLLIHMRDAMHEFIPLLPQMQRMATDRGKRIKGVMHCFSGTAEEALTIMQYGDFYFGIGGIVTYKKSTVPETALAIGLQHIVIETDAPYLSPVPHRGKRNEPAHVSDTAHYLANLFGKGITEIDRITTQNAKILFNIE